LYPQPFELDDQNLFQSILDSVNETLPGNPDNFSLSEERTERPICGKMKLEKGSRSKKKMNQFKGGKVFPSFLPSFLQLFTNVIFFPEEASLSPKR